MWIRICLMRIRILERPHEKYGSGSDLKSVNKIPFPIKIFMLQKINYYALYEVIIYER